MARPNIVWLTLESVRADHTTVHGYERDTTPNLQRIAEDPEGVALRRCFSQSMWTPASSASILTGTHLFRHGVGLDGSAERPLPDDLRTLPELLSERGYRTGCLSPNPYLGTATGLDRGFDDFRWLALTRLHRQRETIPPLLKYLARLRSYGPGATLDGQKHSLTYPLLQVVRKRIRSYARSDDPFFLYAHCPNPHHPYTPPRKWLDEYTDGLALSAEEALELSLDTFRTQEDMKRTIVEGCDFSPEEWAALRAMYDAEIAYADEFVGRVFEQVRRTAGETVVVVTADHGDLFGEHGLLGHNLVLDDGLTHVPAVIHGLDGLDAADDGLAQHIDLTRTVAEYAGCTSDQFQGTDLRDGARDYAVSQRGEPDFESYLEHDPAFDTSRYHGAPVTAVRTEEFKYLHGADRQELFRLPDETTDVGEQHPEVEAQLRRRAEQLLDGMETPTTTEESEFDEEMKQQLADLGYL